MNENVFLSWSNGDESRARALKNALEKSGVRVFWSREISTGDDWLSQIRHKLDSVACVVVLWSKRSVESLWVRSEASEAANSDKLVPVLLDNVVPPRLFRSYQCIDLSRWKGSLRSPAVRELCASVVALVNEEEDFHNWFQEDPGSAGPDDLVLVDSTWLVPPRSQDTYHVHAIVHGHAKTLNKIRSVEYHLEGWVNGEERLSTKRSRSFELHEHAWSPFTLKATVNLKDKSQLVLRRFINVAQQSPSLEPLIRAGLEPS